MALLDLKPKTESKEGGIIEGAKKLVYRLPGGNALFVFSIVIIVLVFSVYGGFWYYKKVLTDNIEEVSQKTLDLENERDKDEEKKIVGAEKKLENIKDILDSHVFSSKVFSFLEEFSNPQVSFSSFTFNAIGLQVELSGRAASYEVLAKQMVTFQNNSNINKVDVSGIQLSQEGGVEFEMEMGFKQELVK